MSIKLGLHGANGRMGIAIDEAVSKNDAFSLVAKFTKHDTLTSFALCDVIIDFSSTEALSKILETALKYEKKILIGTTGLSNEQFEQIKSASESIAILYAPNTSIGANLLIEMSAKIAKFLHGYDIEITDTHHKNKKDSPSGTALAISSSIESSINDLKKIRFSSIRTGDVCGEHEVIFTNENEIITIGAKALSRSVFADGALVATKWLNTAPPGLYTMRDVFKF